MKRKYTTFISLVLVIALIFTLSACGGGSSSSGSSSSGSSGSASTEKIVWGFGHPGNAGVSAYDRATVDFANEIAELTNGRVEVQIFPASQMGTERDVAEQIQIRSGIEFGCGQAAPLANFIPELQCIDMPFLFDQGSAEQAWANFDGAFGDSLKEAGDAANLHILSFGEAGRYKAVMNNRSPIRTLDDMKGLKIRTQEAPQLIAIYKAFGADPTPIAFPETYMAIQTGVVDAYEGGYEPFWDIALYELCDYVTELNALYASSLAVCNYEWYLELDDELRNAVDIAGAHWGQNQRKYMTESIERCKQVCIDEGLEIIEFQDVDRASFMEAAKAIWAEKPEFEKYREMIIQV